MTNVLLFGTLSAIVIFAAAFQARRGLRGQLPLPLAFASALVAVVGLVCFGSAVFFGTPTFGLGVVMLLVLTYLTQRVYAYRYQKHGRHIAEGYMRARAQGKEQLKAYIRGLRERKP